MWLWPHRCVLLHIRVEITKHVWLGFFHTCLVKHPHRLISPWANGGPAVQIDFGPPTRNLCPRLVPPKACKLWQMGSTIKVRKSCKIHQFRTHFNGRIFSFVYETGGLALSINFWLGDRNQFIRPGVVVYLALCDKLMGTCGLRNRDQNFQPDSDQKGTLGSQIGTQTGDLISA